jgi:hypothetical protein
MTEVEWEACTDPKRMLEVLRGTVSDRKLRLFAVACCRQLDAFLFAPGMAPKRPAVEVAERFADGLATEAERQEAWQNENQQWDRDNFASLTYFVVDADAFQAAQQTAEAAYSVYQEYEGADAAEKLLKAHSQLIREIFGNPFR